MDGYVYRGLGLHIAMKGSPKGRRPSLWVLTHLGTGHAVCRMSGRTEDVFPLATQIAECGEWDFDSLLGWKDRDPELQEKIRAIREANPKIINGNSGVNHFEDVARHIAIQRAG